MSEISNKALSTGQRDYEADVAREPNYADGTPRKTWAQLNQFARDTWNAPYQKREGQQQGAEK